MINKLNPVTRIICVVAAIALGAVIFLPMWRIDLMAPQYPEGLFLQIYPNKLGGDIDIINGLNHYIGMKHIAEKDFIEFTVLPWLIGSLAFFGILAAVINRKWFFYTWFGFILAFGVVAMADFYIWLHNYGHNLDPTAAIKVPGQSYQPPLIGYKQLLNFGAYSMPDTGGWIFVGVGLALIFGMWLELRHIIKKSPPRAFTALLILPMLLLSSCQTGPKEIPFGKAACDHCRMTIMDNKYGTELVTTKGKVFFFDDLTCLLEYKKANPGTEINEGSIYISDFTGSGKLLSPASAAFAKGGNLRGPMGGDVAAFASVADRDAFIKDNKSMAVEWKTIVP